MKKRISLAEIAVLEQKLKSSSLEEDTIIEIKGIIAGQAFLLDLFARFVETSGYNRTKIIKEIAKILEIDLKRKSRGELKNSSEREAQGGKQNQSDRKTK